MINDDQKCELLFSFKISFPLEMSEMKTKLKGFICLKSTYSSFLISLTLHVH